MNRSGGADSTGLKPNPQPWFRAENEPPDKNGRNLSATAIPSDQARQDSNLQPSVLETKQVWLNSFAAQLPRMTLGRRRRAPAQERDRSICRASRLERPAGPG